MDKQKIDLEVDLVPDHHTDRYVMDVDMEKVQDKLCWEAMRDLRERGIPIVPSLVFAEYKGRIYFLLKSEYRGRDWDYIGRIPADIQAQGEDSIQRHVELRKNAKLDPIKKQIDEDDRFRANSNTEVTVKHDGQILRGQILSGDGRYYALRMDSPYHVEELRLGGYGQASAMSGDFMFSRDDDGELHYSEDCLKRAKDELIRMYKAEKNRELHPDVISIAERLNRR